ncbi:hypothetical protein ACH4U5_30475 [Streptomyces sp. NPDC020858]
MSTEAALPARRQELFGEPAGRDAVSAENIALIVSGNAGEITSEGHRR